MALQTFGICLDRRQPRHDPLERGERKNISWDRDRTTPFARVGSEKPPVDAATEVADSFFASEEEEFAKARREAKVAKKINQARAFLRALRAASRLRKLFLLGRHSQCTIQLSKSNLPLPEGEGTRQAGPYRILPWPTGNVGQNPQFFGRMVRLLQPQGRPLLGPSVR